MPYGRGSGGTQNERNSTGRGARNVSRVEVIDKAEDEDDDDDDIEYCTTTLMRMMVSIHRPQRYERRALPLRHRGPHPCL